MTDLATPVYCVLCKKQIQSDATFCPHCGSDQRPPLTRPQPEIVEAEIVEEAMSPQKQAQAQPPPTVVYVQQTTSNTNWWPVAVIVLLASPIGCLAVPMILTALGLSVVGIASIIQILPAFAGVIAAVIIQRRQLFDPKIRMWVFYGLIIANILWFIWMGRSSANVDLREQAQWEQ